MGPRWEWTWPNLPRGLGSSGLAPDHSPHSFPALSNIPGRGGWSNPGPWGSLPQTHRKSSLKPWGKLQQAVPQLSLPTSVPPPLLLRRHLPDPKGKQPGPLRTHWSLALPLCPFPTVGTPCSHCQVSGHVSHRGTPAGLLRTRVPGTCSG